MVDNNFTDENLKERLTDEQFHILRQKGTEPPFSGKLLLNKTSGVYKCAACGAKLFSSDTKFDSETGWPSFYDVMDSKAIKLSKDTSHEMDRVEVSCATCGSHLGHVFEGFKTPTGKDYCINSLSLDFEEKK